MMTANIQRMRDMSADDQFPKHRFVLRNGGIFDEALQVVPVVRIQPETIRVGCSVVTVEALKTMLEMHKERYGATNSK
jgi:hypothetical protein